MSSVLEMMLLDLTSKVQATKAKLNKWDDFTRKSCTAKRSVINIKSQPTALQKQVPPYTCSR